MDLFEDIYGLTDCEEEEEFEGFDAEDVERLGARYHSSDEEGEQQELQAEDLRWTRQASPVDEPVFQPFVCPRNFLPRQSALGFIEVFFRPEVFELIVTQTNLYAMQENAGREKKDPDWFDENGELNELTVKELEAFLGVQILMGIVHLPSLRSYWNEEEPALYQPEIATVFPRSQFLAISRYLHLNNNENVPPRDDPAYKLYQNRLHYTVHSF